MKKKIIIYAGLLIAFLGGYWLKGYMEIDLFPQMHVSEMLPQELFPRNYDQAVKTPKKGVYLKEEFELSLLDWSNLWTREPHAGDARINKEGFEGNALKISTQGNRDWSFQHKFLIEATPLDEIQMSVKTKVHTADSKASIGVVLYDENKKVKDWHFIDLPVPTTGVWENVETHFLIPEGAAFIRFRIRGDKAVNMLVDNISIQKVN